MAGPDHPHRSRPADGSPDVPDRTDEAPKRELRAGGKIRLRRAAAFLPDARAAIEADRKLLVAAGNVNERFGATFRVLSRQSAVRASARRHHPAFAVLGWCTLLSVILVQVLASRSLTLDFTVVEHLVAMLFSVPAGLLLGGVIASYVEAYPTAYWLSLPLYLGALGLAFAYVVREHRTIFGGNGIPVELRDDLVLATVIFIVVVGWTHLVRGARLLTTQRWSTVTERWLGMMPAPRLAAYVVAATALLIRRDRQRGDRKGSRQDAVRLLACAATDLTGAIPAAYRAVGATGADRAWVRQRTEQVVAAIQHHRRAVLDSSSADDYDTVLRRMGEQAVGLAAGDWSVVEDYPLPTVGSRLRAIGRHLLPVGVLVAAAFGLPYVPGVAAADSLTGVQIALLVAAVMTLLSVESSTRETVRSAFRDAFGGR